MATMKDKEKAYYEAWLETIPTRYRDAELKDFEGKREFESIIKDVQEGKSVIVAMPSGSGKTHLAYALMKWMEKEKKKSYTYISEIDMKEAYSDCSSQARDFLNSTDCLFIDSVYEMYHVNKPLFTTLDDRYVWKKQTVIFTDRVTEVKYFSSDDSPFANRVDSIYVTNNDPTSSIEG